MGGLFDTLLKSPERRESDILSQVESSIAMGEHKKARSLLRKFVEFEKALGKAAVTGAIGAAKKMAEQPTPSQVVRTRPPVNQLDDVINRLERLRDTI